MFRLVFAFALNGIIASLNLTRRLVLDRPLGITFFHFLIFTTFFTIVLKLISFIKQIQEVENERSEDITRAYNRLEFNEYQGWLRRHRK